MRTAYFAMTLKWNLKLSSSRHYCCLLDELARRKVKSTSLLGVPSPAISSLFSIYIILSNLCQKQQLYFCSCNFSLLLAIYGENFMDVKVAILSSYMIEMAASRAASAHFTFLKGWTTLETDQCVFHPNKMYLILKSHCRRSDFWYPFLTERVF